MEIILKVVKSYIGEVMAGMYGFSIFLQKFMMILLWWNDYYTYFNSVMGA